MLLLAAGIPAGAAAAGDCGMKHVEKGLWCEKCGAVEKADLDKNGKHTCGEKPKMADLCIAKEYHCDKCNMSQEKAGKCKCGETCKEHTEKALILFKCTGCESAGPSEKEVHHKDKCVKRILKKTCSKSGTAPHATK